MKKQSFKEIKEFIKSDAYRYIGTTKFLSIVCLYFSNTAFRWQCAYRLHKGTFFFKILGIILWFFSNKSQIKISLNCSIGYGLYIGHNGPIVIAPSAIIGNNCNLSQFTTIGSNENHAAKIGNNVYIGPNCCIVENVIISDNVTIGAGSVITKDCPENSTVAGNYGKVLNYNNPAKYIKNRWEDK